MSDSPRAATASWLTKILVGLAALAFLAGACSSSDDTTTSEDATEEVNRGAPEDEGPPQDGGTLRVALGAEIDGLNPVQARWSLEGNAIGSSIYDGLMTFDEARNLVPKLAESVTPNADGTVWTITLRPDITFHDGTPFDAEAVKANLEARKAIPISGDSLRPVDTVTVVDPLTVEVNMSSPWFGFEYLLAAQTGYMVAPSMIGAPDSMQMAIGTGPFRLDGTWSPGTPVNVARNENYWGERAHLDGIQFRALVDQISRTAALESGDVDLILTQDPAAVTAFRDKDGFIQVEDFAATEAFVMLNLSVPPFDNIHARRALAYATDRDALNQAVGGGIQQDADQPFTPSEQYHVEDSGYPSHDPDLAAQEVQAYKDDTGQATLSFTLKTTSATQQKAEAELLQAQWSEVGIDASLDQTEQATFLANIFVSDFQAAMFQNFGWVNPENNYIFWHSSYAKQPGQSGGINFGQIRSTELDDALDGARSTSDPEERVEQQKNAVRAMNAELPYIWMYHTVYALAANDNVGGLSAPQGLGFARQDNKPWWPQLWLKQ
jgi:peptide/nickel transport system substrate-binding protein